MKTIIIFVISIILLIVLIEVFCPTKKMGEFVKFSFSSLLIVCVASFMFNNFKTDLNYDISDIAINEEINIEKLTELETKYIDDLIYSKLSKEYKVLKVSINYEINENICEYKCANIKIKGYNESDYDSIFKCVNEIVEIKVNCYGE